MSRNVLIIGATSAIAEAVARLYSAEGANFFLAARNEARLKTVAADLAARGAGTVNICPFDANDEKGPARMLDCIWPASGPVDVALVAHGTLPDALRGEREVSYALREFHLNADSVIACLAELALRFQRQGSGIIAVIGSVAGDRGRASNYLYGAAKAAVSAYASGLRARLSRSGVHVLTVKPGFVATPMTAHLKMNPWLTAEAESVARDIKRAVERRKNVLYTPRRWSWIMRAVRLMPEPLFKRVRF